MWGIKSNKIKQSKQIQTLQWKPARPQIWTHRFCFCPFSFIRTLLNEYNSSEERESREQLHGTQSAGVDADQSPDSKVARRRQVRCGRGLPASDKSIKPAASRERRCVPVISKTVNASLDVQSAPAAQSTDWPSHSWTFTVMWSKTANQVRVLPCFLSV